MTDSSKRRSALSRFLDKHVSRQLFVPTRRFLGLAAAGIVMTALSAGLHAALAMFFLYNVLLVLISAVDLLSLPKRSQFVLERMLPAEADVLKPFPVSLFLTNHSGKTVQYKVLDDLPLDFSLRPAMTGRLAVQDTAAYETKGHKRGRYAFCKIYFRYWGGLGLWQKQMAADTNDEIKILPDLSAVRGVLASTPQQLVLEGKKIFLRRGTGTEFHSLRDYSADDDPRMINWRASARSGSLKMNVFQPERGKIVTVLLDCGRVMGVDLDDRTRLDRTLEAALVFSAVALQQGDLVSVLLFSDAIKHYVPPGRGLGHLRTIVEAIYAVQSDFVESNYTLALEYLFRIQRRRNLVLFFSDMDNYIFADALYLYVMRMRKEHPVLLLSLQDEVMNRWADHPAEDEAAVYSSSVARHMRLDRKRYAGRMHARGIEVLDVPADDLALAAVNRYLQLKSKDQL